MLLEALRKEKEQLKRTFKQLKEDYDSRRHALEKDNDHYHSQVSSLKQTIENLNLTLDTLESDAERYANEIVHVESQISNNQDELIALNTVRVLALTQAEQLAKEILTVQAKIASIDTEIQKLIQGSPSNSSSPAVPLSTMVAQTGNPAFGSPSSPDKTSSEKKEQKTAGARL